MQTQQTTSSRGYSLIQDYGRAFSPCGYCKDDSSSNSTGMHAYRLTVYDYQELLDQGWRRSGKYLYKPDNCVTCCRQYTIRLDVTDFNPSKAHRKLLRKWDQYLSGTGHQQQHQQPQQQPNRPALQQPQQLQHTGSAAHEQGNSTNTAAAAAAAGSSPHSSVALHAVRDEAVVGHAACKQQQAAGSSGSADVVRQIQDLLKLAVSQLQQAASSGCDLVAQLSLAIRVVPVQQQCTQKQKHSWPPHTICTSPCAHSMAAAVRKHLSKQPKRAVSESVCNTSTSLWTQPVELASRLADMFNAVLSTSQLAAAGIDARASNGHINFLQQRQQQQQQQQQQQHQVPTPQGIQAPEPQSNNSHKDPHCQQQQQQHSAQQLQQVQRHQLEVRMVPNKFIREEFELWRKYQVQQHHDDEDDLTPHHFKGFLVDTPLIYVPPQVATAGQEAAVAAAVPSCGYGSFHQQYWLDGKLIAVGVVDVLPRCLSSKYFFWDPDYAWLSLGRYAALREISWVAQQHAAGATDLRYYYLGFYVHTCSKMAYKAEYAPSELLCPKRQVWVRIDQCVLRALDDSPYVVLSDLPGVQMRENLSVPRAVPMCAEQPLPLSQDLATRISATSSSPSVPVCEEHREGDGLDTQLLFVSKQPVRWSALRDSGMLSSVHISMLENSLTHWRGAVGETARTLLYAVGPEMLPF